METTRPLLLAVLVFHGAHAICVLTACGQHICVCVFLGGDSSARQMESSPDRPYLLGTEVHEQPIEFMS